MGILSCIVKDDLTNWLLLYRKLANLKCEHIFVSTAYNRMSQKFILDKDLISIFPKVIYLGPTPLYEDFVSYANFPSTIDLNYYTDHTIYLNFMDHLKVAHIDEIYPSNTTNYRPTLHINPVEFDKGLKSLDSNKSHIGINIFDASYDTSLVLQYDTLYCIDRIAKYFNYNVEFHFCSVIAYAHINPIIETLSSIFCTEENKNLSFKFHFAEPISTQIGLLLGLNGLISGPYGLGVLAYSFRVPSYIIYPFHLYKFRGKTIDPNSNNSFYIETTDIEFMDNINKFTDIIEINKTCQLNKLVNVKI